MVKVKGSDEKQKIKSEEEGLQPQRVKIIMKSTADAGNILHDALYLMTKAAENFIQYLARSAYTNSTTTQTNSLEYEHVAEVVHSKESLDFLHQIIPKKITVRQYKEILAKAKDDDNTSSESEEEHEEKKTSKK